MNVLFIGGTGLISTAATKTCVERGINLYVLNRNQRPHELPEAVQHMIADINDTKHVKEILHDLYFDVVVEWIGFSVDHLKRDYELFKGKTDQYVFISTAAAYQKPAPFLPMTEDCPLGNEYWAYGREKEACEAYLHEIDDPRFHVTIVRPSHTYDDHALIFQIPNWAYPYTLLHRVINDLPIVLVDNGKSKWTLTHHEDFAEAFVDLLGNPDAYNETYHLTSEYVYTWDEITLSLYEAVGKKPNIIYIPSDVVLSHFPDLEGPLLGDNMHDAIFDNLKIKKVAPHYQSTIDYRDVAKKAVKYYLSHPEYQRVDKDFMKRYDQMIVSYKESQ